MKFHQNSACGQLLTSKSNNTYRKMGKKRNWGELQRESRERRKEGKKGEREGAMEGGRKGGSRKRKWGNNLENKQTWGAWVAQSVKHPSLAQGMISPFRSQDPCEALC